MKSRRDHQAETAENKLKRENGENRRNLERETICSRNHSSMSLERRPQAVRLAAESLLTLMGQFHDWAVRKS